VLLIGFIIRIYHDARSSECQIHYLIVIVVVVLDLVKINWF